MNTSSQGSLHHKCIIFTHDSQMIEYNHKRHKYKISNKKKKTKGPLEIQSTISKQFFEELEHTKSTKFKPQKRPTEKNSTVKSTLRKKSAVKSTLRKNLTVKSTDRKIRQ